MVDWAKPIVTRDGRNARFLGELVGEKHYPMVVAVRLGSSTGCTTEACYRYTPDGRFCTHGADIVNVREPQKHQDIIRAFADGYRLMVHLNGVWSAVSLPSFDEHWEYAVAPGQGYVGPAKVADD